MRTNGDDLVHETEYFKFESVETVSGPELKKSAPKFGITKREHFAAMAMQGLLRADQLFEKSDDAIAKRALEQADALIKALNEDKG